MKTLDQLLEEAKRSPGPQATVENFQLAHDMETVKRFTKLCTRICHSRDSKEIGHLFDWLHVLYSDVSRIQEEVR